MQSKLREHHSEYTESGLTVKPVAGTIGAEITGVNLSEIKESDTDLIAALRTLMLRHRVTIFRQQNLNPEQHERFASFFGDVLPAHPFLPSKKNHPNVFEIDYTLPDVQYAKYENSDETKYQDRGVAWHTDVTFVEEPPAIQVLNGVLIPYAGGDTMWCDMVAAFKSLSPKMKDALRGCTALHDGSEVASVVTGQASVDSLGCYMTTAKPPSKTKEELGADVMSLMATGGPSVLKAKHPVVTIHPETGEEVLYVHQGFTRRIVEYSKPESDALLKFLFDWSTRYEFNVRHHWTQGDIILTDNRVTQHAVVGDIGRASRVVNRVLLKGSKPIPSISK